MKPEQRLMRRQEVEEMTGLATTTIYRKMREGTFPRPLKVSRAAVRWRVADVSAWMEGCKPAMGGWRPGHARAGVSA